MIIHPDTSAEQFEDESANASPLLESSITFENSLVC